MLSRSIFALALVCSSVGAMGCLSAAARDAARAAAPAMVDGAVEGVANKDNQRKLADGIDEEAVEKIAERLSGKMIDGTMRALSDPERRQAVEDAFKDVRVPIGMEGAMDIRVASIDPKAVANAVDAAMGKALERVDETQMRGLVRGIVDEAVRTAFTSAREEMDGAGPTDKQIASLTRTLSKEATLGFQDAVDEARRARDEGEKQAGEGSVLWAASRAAESGNTLLDVWKISLLVVGLALISGLFWAVRQHRVHRLDLLQRDEALALLTKRIDADVSSKEADPASRDAASRPKGGAPSSERKPSHPSMGGPPHLA